MSVIRAAIVSAAVSLAALNAASAMTVADLSQDRGFATSAGFTFGDEIAPGRPGRLDRYSGEGARAAAQDYFDFDTLITLGALALAGGVIAALGAAGQKKAQAEIEPAWRAPVMAAVQADLAQFAAGFRRAA